MEDKSRKINISKKVVTSLKKPDTIYISNEFRDIFLTPSNNPEILDIPIITYRIIFKIIADLRKNTFSTKKMTPRNKMQLSLFDEEMRTEHNTYTPFVYKIVELDSNRNTSNIKKALEFLESYQRAWYKQTNSSGKIINSLGGLISQPNFSDGKISFLVSSYWMEKLVQLNHFNETLYSTLMSLKEPRHLLFYLWILRLGEDGTRIHFETITKGYNLNYKSARDLYINFLVPLKKKLNKISGLSFGAGVDGNYINIVKVPLIQVQNLEEKTITSLMIRQKTKYFRERHNLDDETLERFIVYISVKDNFDAITEAYKEFVKQCRLDKIKASEFTSHDFKKAFQNLLLDLKMKPIWEL